VENAATTIHNNRGMLERMEESFRRRTVGRMACFAGQNSKSEYIALKICTVRFSGSLITNLRLFGVADYEFDIKFKMADLKW
jgi:hypothetical protein